MAKRRKVHSKGKKAHKPGKSTNKYSKIDISSGTAQRKKTCPKCGPGVFLAEHKDRVHCGKCGYMEKR
jgi:small subunit ribosomal protein S27Ae